MPAVSDLTRLRIAQAPMQRPVTAEAIVGLLAGDAHDDVEALSLADVEAVCGSLVRDGLLEQITGRRFVHAALLDDDLDRRVIGHLSQPRSVDGLQARLRSDPEVGNISADDVETLLEKLADRGLVKALGEFDTPADLIDAAQGDDGAITMHDEKAAILAERLEQPERAWQLDGVQWIITPLGLDVLRVM